MTATMLLNADDPLALAVTSAIHTGRVDGELVPGPPIVVRIDEEVDPVRLGVFIPSSQIADDLLDITSTSEELGKTAGKDAAAQKATYPSLHGAAASEAQARRLVDEAIEIVSRLDADTERLKEVARFIIARRS